jgi:hydroxymethylbilane synthase
LLKKNKLIIGTRGSKLALWQADYVAGLLKKQYRGIEIEIKKITTTGDKILDVPLAKIGGKALFTKELEVAILGEEIDLAVHSLKDMPAKLPDGLTLSAITKRERPEDALISPKYRTLNNLPMCARVGTSSLRRKAMLLHHRPDIETVDIRGNLDTRLKKLETDAENLDAILLALSGLNRLGWQEHVTEILPLDIFLPAAGQGALAIETREGDTEIEDALKCLNDEATFFEVTAERAFLHQIEGSCQIPVGAYGVVKGETLTLTAVILSPDGAKTVKDEMRAPVEQAAETGQRLAQKMLDAGGREILAELNRE